ncbi:hypothetical protein AKJ09_00469 [Labilithrix luteola]|uniref:Uncharacterized protein n=1 Tax=Labilithrix luteola TaxID=1391654 RepID=A0A0K1PJV9_9BACT|nr:hypothetical protein [Labilithrix luteola]AKU93805.1 hypothetical protein AKJ09_00469 [Labilithrix luteola]
MKHSLVLALCLMGCTGRASLGDQGTSSDPLSAEPSDGGGVSEPDDAGTPIASTDVEFIELVDPQAPWQVVHIDANCHVTDGSGLDAQGDPSRCGELFAFAVEADPTKYGCGRGCFPVEMCTGTVRMHLRDGRDFVRRDDDADRCLVALPGIPTEKAALGAWYSAGGGGPDNGAFTGWRDAGGGGT